MKLFVASLLLLLFVTTASSQSRLEFGNWSPMLGKCKTCQRGQIFQLEKNPGNIVDKYKMFESRQLNTHAKPNGFSVVPANVYPLKNTAPRPRRRDTNKVQLVYLPEGSINDLRVAHVARVEGGSRNFQVRPVRAASFQLSPFLDLETSASSTSLREISPRRPTALVAEIGREKEAHEQIELLEAALNSRQPNVRDGALPRVFIAPTHLPPPPGYVKIPLLPSKNHVQSKKSLPGTFLTSEFHTSLPPGFVQVPLPKNIAQLSHGIPFFNPSKTPQLLSNGQKSDHFNSHVNGGQQVFNRGNPIQQDFIRGQWFPQNFNTGRPVQQDFNRGEHFQQNFNRGKPVQQQFNRGQPIQHFGVQHQQNRGHQPIQPVLDRNQRPLRLFTGAVSNDQNIRGRPRQNESPNFIPTPSPNFQNKSPPRPHNTEQNISDKKDIQQQFTQKTSKQRIIPKPVNNESSGQHQIPDEIPQSRPFNDIQPEPNSFFDIESSVGKIPNSFDDYSSFPIPDFNIDAFEKEFDLHDNQDFEFPNIETTSQDVLSFDDEHKISVQEPPVQEIPLKVTPVQETPLRETPEVTNLQPIEIKQTSLEGARQPSLGDLPEPSRPDNRLLNSFSDDNIPITKQEQEQEQDTTFKLSPQPIESFPSLSPRPVEANSIQDSEGIEPPSSDIQEFVTTTEKIELSSQPIDEPESTTEGKTQTIQPLRPHGRGGSRPVSSRGRVRHRFNPQTTKTDTLIESSPDVPTPTQKPATVNSRFNINSRRRRPIRKQTTTTETSNDAGTGIPSDVESTTLFPPFAVAKKLQNKNTESTPALQNRRKNLSRLRGRFGSRLRAKVPEADDTADETSTDTAVNVDTTASDTQKQYPRGRRVHQRKRLGIRRGVGVGKRGRRVLSRVRKINPASHNTLPTDQKDNELSGAESARISFSEIPVNKVAQALDLINQKETVDKEDTTEREIPPQEPAIVDATTVFSEDDSSNDSGPDNIFNLLNLENYNQRNLERPTPIINNDPNEKLPNIFSNAGSFQTKDDGYVDNTDTFSSQINTPQALPLNSNLSPADSINLKHDTSFFDSPVSNIESEIIPSPFDSLLSFVSKSNAQNAPVLDQSPSLTPESVVSLEPSLSLEPLVPLEPALTPEPIISLDLEKAPQPVASLEPALAPESVVSQESVVGPETLVSIEPALAPVPELVNDPEVAQESALEFEEILAPAPVLASAPVVESEPALANEQPQEYDLVLALEPEFESESAPIVNKNIINGAKLSIPESSDIYDENANFFHFSPDTFTSQDDIYNDYTTEDGSQINDEAFVESTVQSDDNTNLHFENDRFDAFLPETPSTYEDSVYNAYDAEQENKLQNGTIVGSSAHIVYAVALSEPPSKNDFTTQPIMQEQISAATESNLLEHAENTQRIFSSFTDIFNENSNSVADKSQNIISNPKIADESPVTIPEPTTTESHIVTPESPDQSDALFSEFFNTNDQLHSEMPEESSTASPEISNESITVSPEVANKKYAFSPEITNENNALNPEIINENLTPSETVINQIHTTDSEYKNENVRTDSEPKHDDMLSNFELIHEGFASNSDPAENTFTSDTENSPVDLEMVTDILETHLEDSNAETGITEGKSLSEFEIASQTPGTSEDQDIHESSTISLENEIDLTTLANSESPTEVFSEVYSDDLEPTTATEELISENTFDLTNENYATEPDTATESSSVKNLSEVETQTENEPVTDSPFKSDNVTDDAGNKPMAKDLASHSNSDKANKSFLDTFFSRSRDPVKEAPEKKVADESSTKIIGQSTITEVRSSAPMICIGGNCVIGSGIRRRRGS